MLMIIPIIAIVAVIISIYSMYLNYTTFKNLKEADRLNALSAEINRETERINQNAEIRIRKLDEHLLEIDDEDEQVVNNKG